jgi:hypothetical protein
MSHLGKRGDGCRKKKQQKQQTVRPRYLTNKDLATYAGVSPMTIWRWKQLKNFPPARLIGDIEYNDARKFDRWMKKHPTSTTEQRATLAA